MTLRMMTDSLVMSLLPSTVARKGSESNIVGGSENVHVKDEVFNTPDKQASGDDTPSDDSSFDPLFSYER